MGIWKHAVHLAAVVEASPDAVFVLREDRIVYANAAAAAIFAGGRPGDLHGRSFFDLFDTERSSLADRVRLVDPAAPRSGREEHLLRTLSGKAVEAEVRKSETEWDGTPVVILTVRDLGVGRGAERLLRESEERFHSLVEHSLAGIYMVRDERLIYANPTLARIFGRPVAELLALGSVLDLVIEEDRPVLREQLRQRTEGEKEDAHYRLRSLRPDGRLITVEVFGGTMRHGDDVVIIGTVLDVTERLELHDRLAQSERLTALGRAAATIAHEMRNVLMAISPYAEIIARRSAEPQTIDAARRIQEVVRRGKKVTEEILEYTRRPDPVFALVNVCDWLLALRAEIQNAIGPNIDLELDLGDCDVAIRADPAQLNNVIMNLVINARDAMAGSGRLKVGAGRVGGRVEIVVHDSGPGVPFDLTQKVFEPFFTTKHRGTGLGLAVADRVVTMHGGDLTVRNENGARFTITLPEAGEASGHSAAPAVLS